MNGQNNEPSTGARVGAVTALAISALVVLIAVVGAVTGGDSLSDRSEGSSGGGQTATSESRPKTSRATYTVKEGDTLTGISERTGVSVTELEELNPGIDPQALIAGQQLKLR